MTRSDIPAEQIQSAYTELTRIKAILADRGWFPATSGNLSIRVGDYSPEQFQFAITSSGKDKSVHTPEDFLVVDEKGMPLLPTRLKPSAETLIHCEIYRWTGCGAVYHVHTVFNNLVSTMYEEQGAVPLKGIEIIKAFNIWEENAEIHVPILPNYADIPKIAALVEGALNKQVPGILLHNHGIYAWGDSPFDAKRHLEAFEFCFEYAVRKKSLL